MIERKDVYFRIECHPEDVPVRGNAMASGDDDADRAYENEILSRLDAGDEWAWCSVRVVASLETDGGVLLEGDAWLGCCSYRDEADFRSDLPDLEDEALDNLNAKARHVVDAFGG